MDFRKEKGNMKRQKKMSKNEKNLKLFIGNKGITLIALIISIIILLILAGVSLTAIMRRKWNIKSSSK